MFLAGKREKNLVFSPRGKAVKGKGENQKQCRCRRKGRGIAPDTREPLWDRKDTQGKGGENSFGEKNKKRHDGFAGHQ